jgi:hypothetical protein
MALNLLIENVPTFTPLMTFVKENKKVIPDLIRDLKRCRLERPA